MGADGFATAAVLRVGDADEVKVGFEVEFGSSGAEPGDDGGSEWLLVVGDEVVDVPSGFLDALATVEDDVLVVAGDEVDPSGHRRITPEWSPERLRSQYYLGHAVALRRSALRKAGGFRTDLPGAQLYEAALRLSREGRVVRVEAPPTLVTTFRPRHGWGADDERAAASIRRALEEHLVATGGGRVESVDPSGVHVTWRDPIGDPLVSIVIPTRGSTATVHGTERVLVTEAVRGIVERTDYRNVEIVVVIDDDTPEHVRVDLLEIAGYRLRLVPWSAPFSFSGKVNLGFAASRGDLILMLNDDVEIIDPRWLGAMVGLVQRPGVGLVGAMLYFEDDTIQHAGHLYQRSDVTHIAFGWPRGSAGPDDGLLVDREVSGATAACALIRREAYLAAGGFSTLLPGNFNDVDFCQKLASTGWSIVWTPKAELYHFESKTRDSRVARSEIDTAWGRWEHRFFDTRFWPYPVWQRTLTE